MKRLIKSIYFILPLALCACTSAYSKNAYRQEGYDQYDKSAIVDKYHSYLNSNLSVFPDSLISSEVNTSYSAYISEELFDENTEIFLSCEYNDEEYDSEVKRLSEIEITISYKDKSFTNHIKYDEEMYNYPAYIAIDGWSGRYEYALLIKDENKIVYIYLDSPSDKQLTKFADYVKKDTSDYRKITTTGDFTIYNHSFDGGKTWIEFDD